MKIRIIAAGIFGVDGMIPIGTEIAVSGDPPTGWAGKYEIVAGNPKSGAKPVTNPLDHDGDGRSGGSLKGEQSTVAKGRAKATSKD